MDVPNRPERWRRLASERWPWILALVVVALAYYGSYVRHGIGFRDEGQTVAFVSLRLLRGETPIKDVFLGYNVLWFYPVVALYKIFGAGYVLMRGYLLALSTLSALLGFLLVEKTTRRPWLAFLVALVLVLIPGTPGKNYLPLLAIANALCLLHFALAPAGSRAALWKALISGVVLGLSFLIRVDVAIIFSVIWFGLMALRTVAGSSPFRARLASNLGSAALLAGSVTVVHVPFVIDAQRRGFLPEFTAHYVYNSRLFSAPLEQLLKRRENDVRPKLPAGVKVSMAPARELAASTGLSTPAPPKLPVADKKTLQRATVKDLDKDGQNSGAAFLFLIYAPLVTVLFFIVWGVITFLLGLRRREPGEQQRGLAALVLMGGALSTFPQFFHWRTDLPHLSEFMPGYLAASAATVGLLWAHPGTWRSCRVALTLFFVVHAGTYIVRVLPDRWAGTYAVRNKRTKLFSAENGVNVFVSSRELTGLTAIQKFLREHAPNPTDYVVCYPYSPGINLLGDRPTYERNVYVDNATRSDRFDAEAIANFGRYRPAVIVLSDWDINGTDASRFSVWAVKTKTWIQTNYLFQGSYIAGSDAFEIYTRPK